MKVVVWSAVCAAVGTLCAGEVAPEMTLCRPGAVKPAGWLRDYAVKVRDGFTARMDEVHDEFKRAWSADFKPRGPHLQWNGPEDWSGSKGIYSWSAEGGSYWFDGLAKLSAQLGDAELVALAKRRFEPLLAGMNPKAVGFLWWLDRTDPAQLREALDQGSWNVGWVLGNSAKAVAAYYEVTRDERAAKALEWAFDCREHTARYGGNTTVIGGVSEAYRVLHSKSIGETFDRSSAEIRKNPYSKPPQPWMVNTLNLKRRELNPLKQDRHGVTCNESLYSVFRAYQHTGATDLRDSVIAWYDFLDRYCRQPYGLLAMDEEWGWAGAKRGTETCMAAAEMYTRLNLLATLGDGRWGDDVEQAFFNAGPACVSRDFRQHVYFQLPNRTGHLDEGKAFSGGPTGTGHQYRPFHYPLCCTAGLNRIIPNYIQAMWMTVPSGGIAAALYAPGEFETQVAGGTVKVTETTDYPFSSEIRIRVDAAPTTPFEMRLRLPRWCADPSVRVNGELQAVKATRGFASLNRAWKAGDEVRLDFPMKPAVTTMRDMNDFGRTRAYVSYGPLLMAFAYPEKDDNTALGSLEEPVLDVGSVAAAKVTKAKVPAPWDWRVDAPLKLVCRDRAGRDLELVPYGCTKVRVSLFPVAESGIISGN